MDSTNHADSDGRWPTHLRVPARVLIQQDGSRVYRTIRTRDVELAGIINAALESDGHRLLPEGSQS